MTRETTMDTSNVAPFLDDLARKINEEHERVDDAFKAAMGHALKAGELLIDQINRQLSGRILPPLVFRAFGAHCRLSDSRESPVSTIVSDSGPGGRGAS